MRASLLSVAAVCLVTGAGWAQRSNDPKPFSEEQRQRSIESVELVWSTVRSQHWNRDLLGVNWDAARTRALAAVRNAADLATVRRALWEMISLFGESHFSIIPSDLYTEIARTTKDHSSREEHPAPGPVRTEAAKPERNEDWTPGIVATVIDGLAVVVDVDSGSPVQRAGVKPGWLIEAVDGRPLASVLTLLRDSPAREQESLQARFLSHYLNGAPEEKTKARMRDSTGRMRELVLSRVPPKGWLVQFSNVPETRVWFEARRLPAEIGYVRFNLFLDPEKLMPLFATAIEDCLKCRGVVLDLRGNSGGIGVMSMGMAGWFISQHQQRLGTMQSRTLTWDFEIHPRPDTFDGPLAILVDGATASTAEILAGGLQDLGRAVVVGSRTAGAALPSMIIKLPNGDGFQYPVAQYTSRGGKSLEAAGVTPDIVARHSRAALLAGRDLPLEAAVEWIRKEVRKGK